MRARTLALGLGTSLLAASCSDDSEEEVSNPRDTTVTTGGIRTSNIASGGSRAEGGTSTIVSYPSGGAGRGGAEALAGSGAALGAGMAGAGGSLSFPAVCGDNKCDATESSASCCRDCGCPSVGTVCHRDACVKPLAISAGGFHTCVLIDDGSVECWGGNDSGEIGNGTTGLSVTQPTKVSGLNRAVGIAVGSSFTCALIDNGTVRCWGDNRRGQLGNDGLDGSPIPVTVLGISSAVAVAAGYDSACAVLSGGSVQCWGNNSRGQLGNGTTVNSSVPVPVVGLSNATQLAIGLDSACAVTTDGTVVCWGGNSNGQLGNGTTMDSSIPVTVKALTGVKAVAAMCDLSPDPALEWNLADGSACALLLDGSARCWGSNGNGELGKGATSINSRTPVPVLDLACGTSLAVGDKFACVAGQSGKVACWGFNGRGQLGNGTEVLSPSPVQVSNLSNAVQVAAGMWHECALLSSGAIQCWGDNLRNQLGRKDVQNSPVPLSVDAWSDPPRSEFVGSSGSLCLAVGSGGATSGGGSAGVGGFQSAGGVGASTTGGNTDHGGNAGEGGVNSALGGIGGIGAAANGGGGAAGVGGAGGSECSVPGATECVNSSTVRTCTNGWWHDSPCGFFELCSATACRSGCADLVVPANTEVACYMPSDPYGEYHGAAITVIPLVSDPVAFPVANPNGSAFDTRDTDGELLYVDDTYSPVSNVPLGLVWHTESNQLYVGRLYLAAYLKMASYVSRFGSAPASIALHVKMRRTADATRAIPRPAFVLWDGDGHAITPWRDESATMAPSTDWRVHTRAFSAEEVGSLQLTSDWNSLELDFGGDAVRQTPPQNVDVAWFAVTYGTPK